MLLILLLHLKECQLQEGTSQWVGQTDRPRSRTPSPSSLALQWTSAAHHPTHQSREGSQGGHWARDSLCFGACGDQHSGCPSLFGPLVQAVSCFSFLRHSLKSTPTSSLELFRHSHGARLSLRSHTACCLVGETEI